MLLLQFLKQAKVVSTQNMKGEEMKEFDFYSIMGVMAPGAFTLFGVSILIPELRHTFLSDDIGVGNLGIFLIIAYVAGQFVQAFGNMFEWIWWKCWRGMPSDWPRSGKHLLLSVKQIDALPDKISTQLHIKLDSAITKIDADSWFGITRQIYAAVSAAERSTRIDRFNANYGLNRGMAVSLVLIAAVILITDIEQYRWSLLAGVGCIFFAMRMHRFGKHYAREMFVQFLQLP